MVTVTCTICPLAAETGEESVAPVSWFTKYLFAPGEPAMQSAGDTGVGVFPWLPAIKLKELEAQYEPYVATFEIDPFALAVKLPERTMLYGP